MRTAAALPLVAAAAFAGCAGTRPAERARPPAEALARLTFLEDDFARARAESSARGAPIFVDAWTPW